VFVSVVSTGPDGHALNSSYNMRYATWSCVYNSHYINLILTNVHSFQFLIYSIFNGCLQCVLAMSVVSIHFYCNVLCCELQFISFISYRCIPRLLTNEKTIRVNTLAWTPFNFTPTCFSLTWASVGR
jgi:hypothetical protein